jgi:polar amino acid transport system substrate-binding protein
MHQFLLRRTVVALAIFVVAAATAQADLQNARERGQLVVGVKADYKPYGYRDPSSGIVGIEPDLAQEVADKLGLKLELIPVVAANRMQFLQQGKIDLMIATMTDTPERRNVVSIVEPPYYASGTNVLAPKKVGLKDWPDLDGKPICGIQGAFYNKKTQTEFGAKIIAFPGAAEVLTALGQGSCLGFVYDDSFIVSKLREPEWSENFEMPLPTIDESPWGLAVAQGDDEFYELMSEMIKEWHKSGRILELETEYGVPNTPFALEMHEKFKDL